MDDVSDPFAPQRLKVDEEHALYIQQSGNPNGIPAIFLHGGPGSGCQPGHRKLFDLQKFHVIAMDQRGAGQSTPHGSLSNNTTWDLVHDLEKIREELAIEKWMVIGGSWGATLALAYAQIHPERVSAIALRSLFLGTSSELQRAFLDVPQIFYPNLFENFLNYLPESEWHEPLNAYYRRLLHPDPDIHLPASYIWHDYERALSQLVSTSPLQETIKQIDSSKIQNIKRPKPNTPRMEAHYFSQNCFLQDNQLLNNMNRITHLPGGIVQSRYDLLCPPTTSFSLVKRWSKGKVVIVESAGHAQNEPGVFEALRGLIDNLADMIAN